MGFRVKEALKEALRMMRAHGRLAVCSYCPVQGDGDDCDEATMAMVNDGESADRKPTGTVVLLVLLLLPLLPMLLVMMLLLLMLNSIA